ncbi:MAG: hypothetical protein H6Q90_1082 [Deltaproteobacteria bacterium]|nr:hypothetical protein [Deltaproteobacteria bacterium]
MGCTNCGSKVGCDHRKGAMMEQVDQALDRLYPTRTWGEPCEGDDGGLPPDELAGLADELATELNAATFVRPGDDSEPCDFIYALCLGRPPCIVQVRDHGVAAPAEWHGVDLVQELYLRLVISHRARLAAVQQVAIDLMRAPDGRFLVRESPRAGVYDAPLLHRMQKLVAVLPAYELLHVDFGEIAHAPPGFHAGTWRDLFAGDPSIANYLFYPQPTTMIATTLIDQSAGRPA